MATGYVPGARPPRWDYPPRIACWAQVASRHGPGGNGVLGEPSRVAAFAENAGRPNRETTRRQPIVPSTPMSSPNGVASFNSGPVEPH